MATGCHRPRRMPPTSLSRPRFASLQKSLYDNSGIDLLCVSKRHTRKHGSNSDCQGHASPLASEVRDSWSSTSCLCTHRQHRQHRQLHHHFACSCIADRPGVFEVIVMQTNYPVVYCYCTWACLAHRDGCINNFNPRTKDLEAPCVRLTRQRH